MSFTTGILVSWGTSAPRGRVLVPCVPPCCLTLCGTTGPPRPGPPGRSSSPCSSVCVWRLIAASVLRFEKPYPSGSNILKQTRSPGFRPQLSPTLFIPPSASHGSCLQTELAHDGALRLPPPRTPQDYPGYFCALGVSQTISYAEVASSLKNPRCGSPGRRAATQPKLYHVVGGSFHILSLKCELQVGAVSAPILLARAPAHLPARPPASWRDTCTHRCSLNCTQFWPFPSLDSHLPVTRDRQKASCFGIINSLSGNWLDHSPRLNPAHAPVSPRPERRAGYPLPSCRLVPTSLLLGLSFPSLPRLRAGFPQHRSQQG